MGVGSAVAVMACELLLSGRFGTLVLAAVAAILTVVMSIRFVGSGKIMPALIVATLSFLMTLLYAHRAVVRSYPHNAGKQA